MMICGVLERVSHSEWIWGGGLCYFIRNFSAMMPALFFVAP